jgi:hypothetical protein
MACENTVLKPASVTFLKSSTEFDFRLFFFHNPVLVNKGLTERLSGATEKIERKDSPGCGTSETVW